MKITSTNGDNKINYNLKTLGLLNTIRRISFFLFISIVFCQSVSASAQIITQPVGDVSTTIKKYVYTYNINGTSKKDIRYIIIKSSAGDVKSCFDACDVCFAANKGYSQNGSLLRCNNCGNSFNIDELGSQGKGGCWPGHLIHYLNANNVEFNVIDIESGAYLFPLLAIGDSQISDQLITIDNNNNKELRVTLYNSNLKNIELFALDGTLCKTLSVTTNTFNIDISELPSGVYFILSELDGNAIVKKFSILR